MIYVYVITNLITNSVYFGKTHDPEKRWKGHQGCAKNPKLVIHKALQEYGIENFNFSVLASFETDVEASRYERILIQNRLANDGGLYNMTKGGAGIKLFGKYRKHISIQTKLAMNRDDVKKRLLDAQSRTRKAQKAGVKTSWKKLERREKHSISMFQRILNGYGKKVVQIDHDGKETAIFFSETSAAKICNISRTTLKEHLKGNLKHAGGFTWKYFEDKS